VEEELGKTPCPTNLFFLKTAAKKKAWRKTHRGKLSQKSGRTKKNVRKGMAQKREMDL